MTTSWLRESLLDDNDRESLRLYTVDESKEEDDTKSSSIGKSNSSRRSTNSEMKQHEDYYYNQQSKQHRQDIKFLLESSTSVFHKEEYDVNEKPGVDPVFAASFAVIKKNMKQGFELLESTLSFEYIFHISWTTYLLVVSLLGGVIMHSLEGGKVVCHIFIIIITFLFLVLIRSIYKYVVFCNMFID